MPRSFDLTPLTTLLKTRPYSIFFSFEIISLTPYVIKQFKKPRLNFFLFLTKSLQYIYPILHNMFSANFHILYFIYF